MLQKSDRHYRKFYLAEALESVGKQKKLSRRHGARRGRGVVIRIILFDPDNLVNICDFLGQRERFQTKTPRSQRLKLSGKAGQHVSVRTSSRTM